MGTAPERNGSRATVNGGLAIEVVNLNKYFGERHILKNVTFSVKRGEVLGFLGPNGAGKTTTMRILTGFMPPTSGEARVAGYDVYSQSLQVRSRIGYLPENVPLYQEMTVSDYLTFAARLRHVKNDASAVERAMELVNLNDHADVIIGKLSKGYRQRVGIAQAIVHEPEVLILDEPTIGLDPRQIIEVRQLIRTLGQEHTIILSTHILPEVSQTCSRVLIIHEGEIVAEDTPRRLGTRVTGNEHIFLQVAQPAPEIPHELEKIQGVLSVVPQGEGAFEIETTLNADRRAEIAAMAVQRGWGVLELRHSGLSLEEVFLQLTTREAEPDEQSVRSGERSDE